MNGVKDIFAIEWTGPYSSLEEIKSCEGSETCFIYLITGRVKYERSFEIKYIGITKRPVYKRLNDKDHQVKQDDILNKQFWAGKFAVPLYNDLDLKRHRKKAELLEYLLVRYLYQTGCKLVNNKKKKSDPKKSIGIISHWYKKSDGSPRYNKPSILSNLPDVLIYSNMEFWSADKLKYSLDTSE